MADQERNNVAIQIEEKLANAEPLLTTECCIYRVPHETRKNNSETYTPKVISIGPFHYGNQRLRNMESHKLLYCKRFIEQRAHTSLDSLVSCVQESEPDVRRCYSESIELSLTCPFPLVTLTGNAIPFEECLEHWITYDLLLLENQLPFFILFKLYTRAFPSSLNNNRYPPSLENLIFNVFDQYTLQFRDPTSSMKHFTDLLRISQLPPAPRPPRTFNHFVQRQIYSATQLKKTGVKFKVKNEEGHSLDLKLISGHCIEIRKLDLWDDTETLFRNMMALEECHYIEESYVTDLVIFLDDLINTSEDVDVLVQNGIIRNMLGNNEAVAELFNGLSKNIVLKGFNSDYYRIFEELEKYCNHPWNEAMATLRSDYCRTPWQVAASIAGIVLLILTFIQTVSSILQVLQA
ncbi:UPF0481 protein At3g47200-like [Gastrolobium bilobum]|uniref:UPF0481 protein At3g47200-like n=1 Tax=Gastrolobium bilobum TaxID=150636 RepID=UPI002AB300A1|nr:UPF0481 protein At3g47200-like [Gastrolobium bilobum]